MTYGPGKFAGLHGEEREVLRGEGGSDAFSSDRHSRKREVSKSKF